MEQGWDPEVKRYFRKIISSFSYGLLWLMSGVTAGLYYRLAYRKDISVVYVILFYACFIVSLLLLLRYLYRLWKK
jgi:uncharacterized membrane protein